MSSRLIRCKNATCDREFRVNELPSPFPPPYNTDWKIVCPYCRHATPGDRSKIHLTNALLDDAVAREDRASSDN